MPDCDYGRGEEPLSEEKIKHLAHTFLKYGVIEKRHESLQTHQKVGHAVESYLLPAPASIKGIDGKTRNKPSQKHKKEFSQDFLQLQYLKKLQTMLVLNLVKAYLSKIFQILWVLL